MAEDAIIGEIKKNGGGDVIRVTKRNYKNHDFIDIRTYYRDDHDELKPTKKGVTIPVEKWPEFTDLIGKIEA